MNKRGKSLLPCARRLVLLSVVLAYPLFTGTAHAQATAILTDPARPVAGELFEVIIEGQWPYNCVPTPEAMEATLAGGILRVLFTEPVYFAPCSRAFIAARISVPSSDIAIFDPVHELIVLRYEVKRRGDAPRLEAFGVTAFHTEREPPRPEAGLWWPGEAFSGSGLMLAFDGRLLGVLMATYDESGKPTWALGISELASDIVGLEMQRFRFGAPWGVPSDPPEPEFMGDLWIRFADECRANTWWVTEILDTTELEVVELPIEPLLTTGSCSPQDRGSRDSA